MKRLDAVYDQIVTLRYDTRSDYHDWNIIVLIVENVWTINTITKTDLKIW